MLTQATLEGAVRSEMLTGEDVPLLLELLQWEPLPLDYGELRDHYKLVFEAMIWVKIYGLDVPNLQGSGRLGNAPEGLTNYWLRRFEGPITRWVATSPRGIDPILKNFRDQPRLKQISDLHQWFLRLGQLVPQAEEVFRSVERDHQQ
jgi:hypothetical protein